MEAIKATVDKIIHPQKDNPTAVTHGNYGNNSGTHHNHEHPHSTGLDGSHTASSVHKSEMANKLDPRVPDHRNPDDGLSGQHHSTGPGNSGTHHNHEHHHSTGLDGSNTASNLHGKSHPHNSAIANKLDPTVPDDENPDHRLNTSGQHHSTGLGSSGLGSSGLDNSNTNHHSNLTSSSGLGNNPTSTNRGPHEHNTANTSDPRVDSNPGGLTGTHGTHTGTYGTNYGSNLTSSSGYGNDPRSTNHGPHEHNTTNTLDPRIESNATGSSMMNKLNPMKDTHSGPHTSTHTDTHTGQGPVHESSLLNKIDPRVDDKDLKGTHGQHHSSTLGTDTTRQY